MEETELPPDPDPTNETSAPRSAPAQETVPLAVTPVPSVLVEAHPTVPPPVPHADRSTGLVIFGIVQIILGLLAALMIPLAALGAFVSRLGPGRSLHLGQLVSAALTYGFIAATLVTLGIGSVQSRRWARALTLIISWYWLIMGVLVTVLLTALLPVLMRTALQQQKNVGGASSESISTAVMAVIVTLIIIFSAFFLVAVPIAFVVFYSRADVAATCRERDPVERWTDRTPLPVLGASVVLFVGAFYFLSVGLTMPVFPFFGRYLTGIPGASCLLVLAALDGYLAVAFYRLRVTGWWIAAITMPIRLLSMALTYIKADLMSAYSRMGRSDAEVRILDSNPIFHSHVILWWSLISILLFFGYVLWIKRYFKTPAAAAPTTMPTQAP